MPFKPSKEQRDAVRAEHGRLSVPQLVDKYRVSRATIHRVLGRSETVKESTQTVNVPVLSDDFAAIADVVSGRASREPEPREEPKPDDPLMSRAAERLADHLFAQPEPELAPEPEQEIQPRENPVERNAVIQRIVLNLENFAPMFAFVHNKAEFVKSLHSRSLPDLKGILLTMEQTRTTVNLANQFKQAFLMASKATEVLGARYFTLKTDGFVDALHSQKQELDMIFRELAIEYAPRFNFQTRPEMRLGLVYVMTLLQVDNTNRIKAVIASAKEDVPAATQESFADL